MFIRRAVRKGEGEGGLLGLLFFVLFLLFLGPGTTWFWTEKATVTVEEKYMTSFNNKIVVRYEDGHKEVLTVNRDTWRWYFYNDEDFGEMQTGKKYYIRNSGFRWGFFYSYKNVYDMTPISQ